MNDTERAERYFNEYLTEVLCGLTDEGVAFLRRQYMTGVLQNPEALGQLRELYPETR